MVILIGTGWSYLKVFLAEKEKKILMVVIPLQVMAEVAIIILDEDTPAARNWCAICWGADFQCIEALRIREGNFTPL